MPHRTNPCYQRAALRKQLHRYWRLRHGNGTMRNYLRVLIQDLRSISYM